MTNPSQTQYMPIIEDTQASLTAALAKIEALKLRQKQLIHENIQLKSKLSGKQSGDEDQNQQQPQQEIQQSDVKNGTTVQGKQENKENVIKQFRVKINNGQKESVGYVRFIDNKMELLEVKAEVNPESYISMCFLPPKTSQVQAVGRSAGSKSKGKSKSKGQKPKLSRFSAFPCLTSAATATADEEADTAKSQHSEPQTIEEWTHYLTKHSVTPTDISSEEDLGEGGQGKEYSCQIVWTHKDERGLADVLTRRSQPAQRDAVLPDGAVQTYDFMASTETRESLSRCLQAWASGVQHDGKWYGEAVDITDRDSFIHLYGTSYNSSTENALEKLRSVEWGDAPQADIVHAPPVHMTPAKFKPNVVSESAILSELNFRCLANQLPSRHRLAEWELLYSTQLHGISLQTLYRKVANCKPLVTVVRDQGGSVFGCFTPETWKVQPRYYGTGETFVFQLLPHMIAYMWDRQCSVSNEYFQYGQQDSMGLGGGPHFALWLDGELMNGNSGTCNTFGSPCLASQEDFKIKVVEVWHVC
eukprot:TRINITY_DN677_c2_g1_i1.p1 TRINITY_DN677_c2_g1~~TRINITY_DN677_c2_g1_i1.p1  ORF type:complete len:549 (-),score=67.58 TRINITY_DN677_c2_g1_i1:3181-4770(-)